MQAYAIIAVVLLSLGFGSGWQVNGWRLGQKITQMERDIAQANADAGKEKDLKEAALSQRNAAVADALIAEIDAERAESKIINREVIRYVENPSTHHCNLHADWLRIHDAAATGRMSNAAGSAVTPAGKNRAIADPDKTDANALAIITANYEQCRRDRTRVDGWQKWYREVAK